MDKHTHNIDDIFKKIYQQYGEDPSENVWDKINTGLDKEELKIYKKRFIGWKRIAIFLFFLVGVILINESRDMHTHKENIQHNSNNNSLVLDSFFYKPVNAKGHTFAIKGENNLRKSFQTSVKNDFKKSNESYTSKKLKSSIISANNWTNKYTSHISSIASEQNKSKLLSTLDTQHINLDEPKLKIITSEKNTNLFSKNKNYSSVNNLNINNDNLRKSLIRDAFEFSHNGLALLPKSNILESNNISNAKILVKESPIKKVNIYKTNELISKHFKPYWALSGFTSIDRSEYNLNNDQTDLVSNVKNEKDEINNREKHNLSISTSLIATRQLTKHLGFKTGIIYSNTSISIDPQEMYAGTEPNGAIGYKFITSSGYSYLQPRFGLPPVIGDSLLSTTAQHNFHSFGIPIQILYRIDRKKVSIIPSAGISFNYIYKTTVRTKVKDAFNTESVAIDGLNGMRKIYLDLIGGVNFQFYINNKWSFNLMPSFRYAITPITQSNVVKTYPYSIGISSGLTYIF